MATEHEPSKHTDRHANVRTVIMTTALGETLTERKQKMLANSMKFILNDNKKDSQLLRSECATLEHQSTECLNDILKEILEDVNNLEKDFRKNQQSDLNEIAFLKQQAGQLQQEKVRLQ